MVNYRTEKVKFSCDRAFEDTADQSEIYSSVNTNISEALLSSQSVTMIFYGQTGSGKTYSMFGNKDGVVFNALKDVFKVAGS